MKFATKGWQMKATHKVLSTKKLDPSLVEKARENGIEVVEQEFISIKPIRNKETLKRIIDLAENGKRTIALTSANAAEVLASYMHVGDTYYVIHWKIFCLSGKTKEAVLSAKFLEKQIAGEAVNAASLAGEIIRQHVNEIVFFCGNKRRDELPNILKEAGVIVHEVVLYETVGTPQVSTDDIDGVLFFSPSAVQSFFSVNQLRQGAVCFAIGQTTATSIADFTDNRIIMSESPNQEMMLSSVQFYFQNSNCYE
jgi:uroporphyrinogen-III synthase